MIIQPKINVEEIGRLASVFAVDIVAIERTRDVLGSVYRTLIGIEGYLLDNPIPPPHHLRLMNDLDTSVNNLATASIQLRNIAIGRED